MQHSQQPSPYRASPSNLRTHLRGALLNEDSDSAHRLASEFPRCTAAGVQYHRVQILHDSYAFAFLSGASGLAFPPSIAVISSSVDLRESIRLLLLLQYRQRRVECAPVHLYRLFRCPGRGSYYTRPVQPSRHRRFRQKIEKFEEGFISDPPCTLPPLTGFDRVRALGSVL